MPIGDLVAGFHKAAYLGIKNVDPDVPVLPASITLGPTTFLENMLDSGISDYYDIFNWHIYDKPSRYPERADHYRQLLSRYGMAGAPDWLTEFGAAFRNSDGPNQTNLGTVDQQTQCRFVAQSITMALAAGADKAFFFSYPVSMSRKAMNSGSCMPTSVRIPGISPCRPRQATSKTSSAGLTRSRLNEGVLYSH